MRRESRKRKIGKTEFHNLRDLELRQHLYIGLKKARVDKYRWKTFLFCLSAIMTLF